MRQMSSRLEAKADDRRSLRAGEPLARAGSKGFSFLKENSGKENPEAVEFLQPAFSPFYVI